MKRGGVLGLAFSAFLVFFLTSGQSGPVSAAPIKLTMVGAWPPGVSPAADVGIRFKDEVNKRAGGKLVIEYKGASEVVPTFDQPEALMRGVFDVWFGAPNYWAGVIPGGYITELSPYEIPDKGPGSNLFNFMVQMYEKKGVRYLGHASGDPGMGNHFMYTQKKVGSIAGLKGMKIRVPPLTRFFVTAVGAEPVTLPPGEIYLALERGTVEGFTWPVYDGFINFGWQEVSKFIILHPLYRNGTGVNMNLAKWNRLPKDLQEVILEAVRVTQIWSQGWISAFQTSQLATMKKAGMKVIEFSPAEARRWGKTANEALWGQFKKVMSADDYAKARKLLGYD
ncbi:MAG: TRAP transporter substrate-binding protein DctP [Candidatus Tectomicrobia bacterium]|nr:TRAP transporter substrate-binding protein DctP [Candidatus Tectomicrobia bacterium]